MGIDFFMLRIKLKHCAKVLFGKRKHWVMMYVDRKNAERLFKGIPFDVHLTMIHSRRYVALSMIKQVAEQYDETQMLLEKMLFEGKSECYKGKNHDEDRSV